MKRYISLKIVDAEAMYQYDFLRQQGKDIPKGLGNQEGYLVKYRDGYVSWSPKDAFDESHRLLADLLPKEPDSFLGAEDNIG